MGFHRERTLKKIMTKKSVAGLTLAAALCASMAFSQGPGGFARPGGSGGGFMAGRGRGGPGFERLVTGAPYSAVEVRQFQERLGDGNIINRTTQIVRYRDSQGRTRTEETITPPASSGKQPYTLITISDPVARQRHVLNSSTMTDHTSRMMVPRGASSQSRPSSNSRQSPSAGGSASSAPAARTGRGGSAVTRADLGTQVVNGASARGSQETEVIEAGRIGNSQQIAVVRTTWYSTDLKMPVQIKITDPRRGNSDIEMTNLIQGEPSSALFTVPAGYTEQAERGGRGGAGFRKGPPPAAQ